jgi:hypothetical protein
MLLLEKVYGAHAVTSDIILVTQCDSLWRKRKTQVSERESNPWPTKNNKNISIYDFSLLLISIYFFKVETIK